MINKLNICIATKNNDKTLLYLGAGAGPFIALVAQVQVEEDIAVLNTSKFDHLFHPRVPDDFVLWFFAAAERWTGARDAG